MQVSLRLAGGRPGEWRTTHPMLQPGGTILFVDGVLGDDHYIEVEVAGPPPDNR